MNRNLKNYDAWRFPLTLIRDEENLKEEIRFAKKVKDNLKESYE